MRLLVPFMTAVALTLGAAVSYVWGQERPGPSGGIAVTSAWARATPPGASVGSAYVDLRNDGTTPDRLVGAETPAAGAVSIHITAGSADVAQMRPAEDGVALPPGETVAMAPGGLHLMLMGLVAPLQTDGSMSLTLLFEAADPITVTVPVEPVGSPGPEPTPHGDHSAH